MSRFAVLLLLFVGCTRVPPRPVPPSPEPGTGIIDVVGQGYAIAFRQSCLDAAGKLRSGEWKTDEQYRDGHKELVKAVVLAAGQPFADKQQAEATPFTPEGMATWLEAVAREGQE
jgi:hypothetical protein